MKVQGVQIIMFFSVDSLAFGLQGFRTGFDLDAKQSIKIPVFCNFTK